VCACMYSNRHRGLGWVDCELGELSWDLLYFTSMPGLVSFFGCDLYHCFYLHDGRVCCGLCAITWAFLTV